MRIIATTVTLFVAASIAANIIYRVAKRAIEAEEWRHRITELERQVARWQDRYEQR